MQSGEDAAARAAHSAAPPNHGINTVSAAPARRSPAQAVHADLHLQGFQGQPTLVSQLAAGVHER